MWDIPTYETVTLPSFNHKLFAPEGTPWLYKDSTFFENPSLAWSFRATPWPSLVPRACISAGCEGVCSSMASSSSSKGLRVPAGSSPLFSGCWSCCPWASRFVQLAECGCFRPVDMMLRERMCSKATRQRGKQAIMMATLTSTTVHICAW